MIAKATMWGVIAIAVTLMWSSSVMAGDATSIFTGYANVSPPLGTFTYIRYTPEGKPFMVMIDGFGKYNHRAVNVDNLDQEFAEADAWVKGTGAD
jgi:hypothetical protein